MRVYLAKFTDYELCSRLSLEFWSPRFKTDIDHKVENAQRRFTKVIFSKMTLNSRLSKLKQTNTRDP